MEIPLNASKDPKKYSRAEIIKNLKADLELLDLQAKVEECDARIWTARVQQLRAQSAYAQMTTPPDKEQQIMKEEFEKHKNDSDTAA